MTDALREIAIAAPAAFLLGAICGFFVRSRWSLVKRKDPPQS